jgi:GT2 family glycosyltransferase
MDMNDRPMAAHKIAAFYCVHDDAYYLAQSIATVSAAGPVFVFVSKRPWNDQPGDWEHAAAVGRGAGAEVVVLEWDEELAHRDAARQWLADHDFTHGIMPDGDELLEPSLLEMLVRIAEEGLAERVTVDFDTYWKSPEYVIRPRERIQPQILTDLRATRIAGIRYYDGGRLMHLATGYGVVHHLSYAGPDERILRKLRTWSHRPEVVNNWWEDVWLKWDGDKLMRNIHPTHPPAYGWAERIHVPLILEGAYRRWRELGGLSPHHDGAKGTEDARKTGGSPAVNSIGVASGTGRETGSLADRVSVVIPLHGGTEDIRQCLTSLQTCRDLVQEVVVVDDRSPDDAAKVAAGFGGVKLIQNKGERGFASTCNSGVHESAGELILLLNSDTVVPRIGLQRLVEALLASDDIAAAGPFTNRSGHHQQIAPTYTSLDTLDLFAEDFAEGEFQDLDLDMLVGFCLLVRRSVLDEVGLFDTRFGLGTFEDNDLCYRMRRAGYRLVLAARSFVHHHGHRTMSREQIDLSALLARNEQLYREKWRADLESGFASHLSGLAPNPIRFQSSRVSRIASDVSLAPLQRGGGSVEEELTAVRQLLHAGREAEAVPHLEALQSKGIAEAAFYLGIHSLHRGEKRMALAWMERALQLNPGHQVTQDQVSVLRQELLQRGRVYGAS